jgi:hypothetical protein
MNFFRNAILIVLVVGVVAGCVYDPYYQRRAYRSYYSGPRYYGYEYRGYYRDCWHCQYHHWRGGR